MIVLAVMVFNLCDEYRREKVAQGFMKHIHAGDMAAAEAYWDEHIEPPEPQRELSGRDRRMAVMLIKAGNPPRSVYGMLNKLYVPERFDPLLDAWEASGLEGEDLWTLIRETWEKPDAVSSLS